MSFHSVIAGLTLGLEKETSGVWINFAAIALHKFVIAFSVGVELVISQVSFVLFTKFDFKVKFLRKKSSEFFSVSYKFFPLQATKAQYLISIAIFSLAPAFGTGIGTYLSESKNEDKKEIEHDLVLQILQGKYSQVSL